MDQFFRRIAMMLAALLCLAFTSCTTVEVNVSNNAQPVPPTLEETTTQLGKDLAELHQLVQDAAAKQKQEALDQELAAAQARIRELEAEQAALEAAIGEADAQHVAPQVTASTEAVTLMRQIVIDRHTTSLYRYWERQDTFYKKEHPWGDQYCRSVTTLAGSGLACDSPVWKHILVGDSLLVPAGVVYAQVASGAKTLEAIATTPTGIENLYVLDPTRPVITQSEQAAIDALAEAQSSATKSQFLVMVLLAFVLFLLGMLAHQQIKASRRVETLEQKAVIAPEPPAYINFVFPEFAEHSILGKEMTLTVIGVLDNEPLIVPRFFGDEEAMTEREAHKRLREAWLKNETIPNITWLKLTASAYASLTEGEEKPQH